MPINNPLRCLLFVNSPRNGWSETWTLRATEWRRALLDAACLAEARSYILAQHCVIEWACVHSVIEPWTEQVVITDPLAAQPVWGPTDHDGSGLLWRFETAQGKWVTHLFRAIDDDELVDTSWLRAPFLLPAATPVLPAPLNLATTEQLLTYAFTTFRELTAFHERLEPSEEGLPLWNILPWENVFYRHVSYRPAGRRYRRVSWEAGNYPETPWFSPCGEAVSVLRSCYSAPARFGPAEPPREIRYYFAAPHATVFPLPTVFWGRARDRLISNTDGVGEITGPGSRHYEHGNALGLAPANHYSGTPPDFLGQHNSPWTGGGQTPFEFRPACDLPLDVLGGQGCGGLEDLPLHLELIGGAGAGGLSDLVALIDPAGGHALGGDEDLVTLEGQADGGDGLGGGEDAVQMIEVQGGAGMAGEEDIPHGRPQPINYGSNSGNTNSLNVPMNAATTAGNLLIAQVILVSPSGTIDTPAGWTQITGVAGGVFPLMVGTAPGTLVLFYRENAPSIGNLTVTSSGVSGALGAIVFEFTNIATSGALDVSANNGGTSATMDSGTTAAAQAFDLVFVALASPTATSGSPTSGYSLIGSGQYTSCFYTITMASGAQNCQQGLAGSDDWLGVIATFRGI